MRLNIVHPGADELTYEIREVVEVGERLKDLGVDIFWENIGDPVAKGEHVPAWIKEIINETLQDDSAFRYSPTRGVLATRQFIAGARNTEGGVQITADDILFFNGLGDAISKVYTSLNKNARIIGPDPAYPTHSSAEAAHAGARHITYNLNPKRNWLPDLEDIRNKVKYNPYVAGILIINPDNPTGMVYPRKILEGIAEIAREFGLFIISDEIYQNLVYGGETMTPISQVLGDVPGISMRGLSKEIPWPGARCGWVEFYNKDKDPVFARYAQSLVDAKMLEVCSTTLPQRVIPEIFSDARYAPYLKERSAAYARKADVAYRVFSRLRGIVAPKPAGAFYYSVVFDDGVLNNTKTLPIENPKAKEYVENLVKDVRPDKRFAYYLLAATGICIVPLSGFNSELYGFRITLLDADEKQFAQTVQRIAESIKQYLNS
jgi:aspartate/methionine/tyrosine aminotransferase